MLAEGKYKELDEKFVKRAMQVKQKMKEVNDNVYKTETALKMILRERRQMELEMKKINVSKIESNDDFFFRYLRDKVSTKKIMVDDGHFSSQLKDAMSIIHIVSEQRRSQFQSKRDEKDKLWKDALPDISDALRNSLKSKMQR